MNADGTTPDIPATVEAVVVFALIAAGVCLLLAAWFAIADTAAAAAVRNAAKTAGTKTETALGNPAQPQASVDFGGIAKLAEAIDKLNRSGRFLIASLAFAATAALAAGAGSIASAAS